MPQDRKVALTSVTPPGQAGSGPEVAIDLAATAARLGNFRHCFFLRRDGESLVELPLTEDGLVLPLESTFSGSCVQAGRVMVADAAEDVLHPRERAVLRQYHADIWLAVPVLLATDAEEASGLVVGLKKAPLTAGSGVQERTVLALVAEQLALHWRLGELDQALASARGRARELEGEAEALLQSLRTAALVLTPDNRLDEANRSAELLLGFQLSAARGLPAAEVLGNDALVDLIERVAATGGGELPELRLGPNAETVIEVRIAPIYDSRGELRRRVVVLNDTTLVKEADELKTQFVSMVSHELRTPLTSIKAFASTLLHDEVGSIQDQREWLQIIDRECDRLTALVNDLLVISRLESGQPLAMQFTDVDLLELLGEVVAAQQALATRHTFAIDGPPSVRVEGDAEKLRQVLANLVNNAVKYSPRGGRVTIAVREIGTEVEVRVSDEGVGIRAEHLNLIFDKFFQVDGSTTRRVGGTGLGLYLTRRLVEAHGGKIWAESEPGIGSHFVATLPRRRHVRDRLGT